MVATEGGQGKRRVPILCATALLVVVGGLGIAHTIRDTTSRIHAVRDAGSTFLKALGSDEGENVCAHMTRTAQTELAADQRQKSCPQAVDALVGPLGRAERHRVATSYDSAFFAKEGSFGHVNVRDNPLQITELLLSESHGKWLVAEMK
ncbi:hypothetical protein [Streptomyces sp. NPDC046759]|uniref:hypothetical protein n=1 Tax=Streptomyces sp. NPDC046759 TaxID=3155019 RepID=UPI0033D5D8BD